MKKTLFTLLAFFVAAILLAITPDRAKIIEDVIPTDKDNGFVIMELFTSQGCSSCPPADNLLGEYAAKNNDRIIPIAFHVDYWNYLGWKDSFSNTQYSQRQSNYDNNFLHASVYTPQLIINGETEMVGSDKEKIKTTVDKALNETVAVFINIKKQTIANGQLQIDYTIDGTIANTTLNAALVQYQTVTKIKAGENRGATLTNYNVVRSFASDAAKNSGSSFIKLPAGVDVKDLSIVLFTQDNTIGKITGAMKKVF